MLANPLASPVAEYAGAEPLRPGGRCLHPRNVPEGAHERFNFATARNLCKVGLRHGHLPVVTVLLQSLSQRRL